MKKHILLSFLIPLFLLLNLSAFAGQDPIKQPTGERYLQLTHPKKAKKNLSLQIGDSVKVIFMADEKQSLIGPIQDINEEFVQVSDQQIPLNQIIALKKTDTKTERIWRILSAVAGIPAAFLGGSLVIGAISALFQGLAPILFVILILMSLLLLGAAWVAASIFFDNSPKFIRRKGADGKMKGKYQMEVLSR